MMKFTKNNREQIYEQRFLFTELFTEFTIQH